MLHTLKHCILGFLCKLTVFDSVVYTFLHNALVFVLINIYRKWIRLYNKNITAFVTQCGFLSDPVPIDQDYKQGDPIESY